MKKLIRQSSILLEGITWPESLRWQSGKLWFSDIYGSNSVRQMDESGNLSEFLHVPGKPSGIGFDVNGDLLVVSMEDNCILKKDQYGGRAEVWCDLSGHVTLLNDMLTLPNGTVYVGDMGYKFPQSQPKPGSLLKIAPDGEIAVVADDLGFPNGMTVTDDLKTLIIAESLSGRLTQFTIGENGDLGRRKSFVNFDELGFIPSVEEASKRPVGPDGICYDPRGGIWVANLLSTTIECVIPGGDVIDSVQLSQPAIDCAIGGNERLTLFVATGIFTDQAVGKGRIETARLDF